MFSLRQALTPAKDLRCEPCPTHDTTVLTSLLFMLATPQGGNELRRIAMTQRVRQRDRLTPKASPSSLGKWNHDDVGSPPRPLPLLELRQALVFDATH